MKLGGVVYLHDITRSRLVGAPRNDSDMFQTLCGLQAEKAIILATTKWCDVAPDTGGKREEQLRSNYWKDMSISGSGMIRFDGTAESAWRVVGGVLARCKAVELRQIQRELATLDDIIPVTDAGQKLRYTLKELLEMLKGEDKGAVCKVLIESILSELRSLNISISEKFSKFLDSLKVNPSLICINSFG